MASRLQRFEAIARKIVPSIEVEPSLHPFDTRNIHPGLPSKVRELFDDGYFPEATFEAFKFLDKTVERHSGLAESGYKLMMSAFNETSPKIALTPLHTTSEKDEQQGYKFIFVGGVLAIRNPRGHEHSIVDDPDNCLDHLSFVSLLLRRLEQSGFV
jgi:uncharacterized protein (TIGR02391 family)